MPTFRDENILVISIGSQTALAQYGLPESLAPASMEVVSKVYQPDPAKKFYTAHHDDESKAIYPVQAGKIVDVHAFNYLFKAIYKTATKSAAEGSLIATLLVTSPRWKRSQIELITQYAFENLKISAFSVVPSSLSAIYAFNVSNALVIDVGTDVTEITPIKDYVLLDNLQQSFDFGGNTINKALARLLPQFSPAQIEALKTSSIYEVLNDDDSKSSWFSLNTSAAAVDGNEDDSGVEDIAAIVSSGRTREILAAREKGKAGTADEDGQDVPNKSRELNSFVDATGQTIQVGKERFMGCEELINKITTKVGEVMREIDEPNKRQDCWDNLIIIGRGTSVKGFKSALVTALNNRYLISRQTTFSDLPSTYGSGHNTPNGHMGTPSYGAHSSHGQHQGGHSQTPTSIRPAKIPEYFPEWKAYGIEDFSFLGAQIASKHVFTSSIENSFVSRNEYNESGPLSIWDV